jgi:PEP-CTERM motif
MFNMQTRAYYRNNVIISVTTSSSGGLPSQVEVSLIGHLEPLTTGDYNNSGIVDAADYVVWRNSVGQTSSLAADGNLNGAIEAGDYGVWSSTFGNHTTSTPLAASSAVPEPASGALAGVALMLAWATRRKKR